MLTPEERKFECIHCGFCCIALRIPVFSSDISYIQTHLKLSPSEFVEDPPDYYDSEREWIANANLRVLRQKHGQCIFRQENCQIYPFRPLACRLFPYSFISEDKDIILRLHKLASFCSGLFTGKEVSIKDLCQIAQKILNEFKKIRNSHSEGYEINKVRF
ncbi:MAG: YkgJ family cysteine cluster protein [Candidatus Hermodarchaeota archaeon]